MTPLEVEAAKVPGRLQALLDAELVGLDEARVWLAVLPQEPEFVLRRRRLTLDGAVSDWSVRDAIHRYGRPKA